MIVALWLVAQALGAVDARDDTRIGVPSGARLVWADEFDGRAIDPARWRFETEFNKRGWFNNEKQYYSARPENARIENGRLVIEARRERVEAADWGGQDYSSARLSSMGAGWTYGFYEIRARIPCARGSWPAIWMLPVGEAKWPEGGEIDIMEHVGWDPKVIHATLHTGLYNHARNTQRGSRRRLESACDRFHRYQLDWRPDAIRIGIDGRSHMVVRNDRPGGKGAWPFDAPFRLILNVAVGGDWGGAKGIDDAALPQRMEVDYVRVWRVPGEQTE